MYENIHNHLDRQADTLTDTDTRTDRQTDTDRQSITETDRCAYQRLSVTIVSIPLDLRTRASSPKRSWIRCENMQ